MMNQDDLAGSRPNVATNVAETLARPRVPALDAIIGRPFAVLDEGFIRVIDYMGNDESVVQAARVSYGAGTKRIHEDRGLIRYLMRHSHTRQETRTRTRTGRVAGLPSLRRTRSGAPQRGE
jgi:hypothetical protein